jgi:BolA family transcriptional regulator, general stress-responsive regulator
MSALADLIRAKLQAGIGATLVEVQDDSDQHVGHGASGAHVSVTVASPQFAGKSSLQRHRMVYDCLKTELASEQIHALQIITKA